MYSWPPGQELPPPTGTSARHEAPCDEMHPWWPGCRAQQFFWAVRFAVPGGDFTVAMGADKKNKPLLAEENHSHA